MNNSKVVKLVILSTAAILIFAAGFTAAQVTGSVAPRLFHQPIDKLAWQPLPQYGGRYAVFYRSPDGKQVGAAFEESGKVHYQYSFTEVGYVLAGTIKGTKNGVTPFALVKGDVFFFEPGTVLDIEISPDFADVTFLSSDQPLNW